MTVEDALEDLERQASTSKRDPGLFQALLHSRPEAMYYDASDSPEKYDARVPALLRDLVQSGRVPTEPERQLLDAAVLDFTSAAPRKQQAQNHPKPSTRDQALTDSRSPSPESGMAVPEGAPAPFWWL